MPLSDERMETCAYFACQGFAAQKGLRLVFILLFRTAVAQLYQLQPCSFGAPRIHCVCPK